MTFYETLTKVLSTKHRVVVKDDDGNYQIFSCEKDIDGDFRRSCWYNTEEEAKQSIGNCGGYTEKEINEGAKRDNWQIVKAYDLEHEEEFKEGEKAQVIDEKSEYYGEILEIGDCRNGKYMLIKDNGCLTGLLLVSQLSYPFKTEETEELTMEEVCKELGRTIKIKK